MMSLPQLKISDACTKDVVQVSSTESLSYAKELMQRHGIRHLPVVRSGKLVGIVSDRDIKAISGVHSCNLKKTEVAEVVHEGAFVTHLDSRVELVSREMAEKHYGCAVVVDGDEVVGIFTTTDACRTLANILSGNDSQG